MKQLIAFSLVLISANAFSAESDRAWSCFAVGFNSFDHSISNLGTAEASRTEAEQSALHECDRWGYRSCRIESCTQSMDPVQDWIPTTQF